MTNAELLQLNPQHLAELRSFFAGFEFDTVDIVAIERTTNEIEFESHKFGELADKLKLDGIFRGKDRTHYIFTAGEDDVFYCFSYAQLENVIERIIFKFTF